MNKKGFTLLELLAVIVVLAIIALIVTPFVTNAIKEAREGAFKNSAYGIINAAELYYAENMAKNGGEFNKKTISYENGNTSSTDFKFKGDKPQSGTIIIDQNGKVALAISNGVKCARKGYNDAEIVIDNNLEDCFIEELYVDASGANMPELSDNLIPVVYNGTNWVYARKSDEWYDYDKKEWANAVVLNDGVNKKAGNIIEESDIALWYVWVPRYKYQLFNAANSSANPQQINIEFESGTSTTGTVSCTTQTSGDGTSSEVCTNAENGNWYTHPAFTFGTQQLTGIWVGKFEVSTTDTTCNTTSNGTNCNKVLALNVKPNARSWRYASVSKFFTSIKKIETDYSLSSYDSHMMKNMEWGAVAYLSHSKYGIGEEIYINNSGNTSNYADYTGRSGGNVGGSTNTVATQYPSSGSSSSDKYYTYGYYTYDGKVVNYDGSIGDYATDRTLGTKASTTGNIYGIYDMSGGALEYVMGNMVNSSNAFYSSNAGFATAPDGKYYDAYTYNTSETTHGRGKLGDATKETLKTFGNTSGGWYGDSANFPYSAYAWFGRGGYFNISPYAGVFYFSGSYGDSSYYSSARAVLVRN